MLLTGEVAVGAVKDVQIEPSRQQGFWIALERPGGGAMVYLPAELADGLRTGAWIGVRGRHAQAGPEPVILANAAVEVPALLVPPEWIRRMLTTRWGGSAVAITGSLILHLAMGAFFLVAGMASAGSFGVVFWLTAIALFPGVSPVLAAAIGFAVGTEMGALFSAGSEVARLIVAVVVAVLVQGPKVVLWFAWGLLLAQGVGTDAPSLFYGLLAFASAMVHMRVRYAWPSVINARARGRSTGGPSRRRVVE